MRYLAAATFGILLVFCIVFQSNVSFAFQSVASKADYWVKNEKFYTNEGEVPSGCFSELMINLNGDDLEAAVFLDRTSLRGCINSNRHDLSENEKFRLSVQDESPSGVYKIRICKNVDGSMREYCDNIIIQFVKRRYISPNGDKDVISIEKLGEW